MKIWHLILICLLSSVSVFAIQNDEENLTLNEISSPVKYIPQAFDVTKYIATIILKDAPSLEMKGISSMTILWKENPADNLFYFHLRGLTVDSVRYNNLSVQYYPVETPLSPVYHYAVVPPAQSSADTAIIKVFFHGKMTNADNFGGVFSQMGYLYSVGVGFRNNYVSSTQHWLASYDLPCDKATFEFNFITPKNMSVASNGVLQSEKDTIIDDSTYKQTVWSSTDPIATNLMTFAVAPYVKVENMVDDIPIVIYSLAKDTNKTKLVFSKVPEMVETFEKLYGEYAFDKVGYVITSLAGGAMEHQTMITMNESDINSMYANRDSINITAAHELSHHWFGNSVTPFDYRDAWFNEGFATFSEAIWYEHLFGFQRYLTDLAAKINYYLNSATKNEGVFPLYDFNRTPPSSNYPITIYYKGAAVAGMLRYELGDSLFFHAVRAYLDDKKYGNMTTSDFEEFLSNYTGENLQWFFNQWVFGKGFPIIEVTTYKSESSVKGYYKAELHVTQTQQQEWGIYKHLPIELVFAGLNGSSVDTVFKMNGRDTVFVVDGLPDFYAPLINAGSKVRSLLQVNKSVTSIMENDAESSIEYYPNPARDFLFVFSNKLSRFSSVKIIDVTGRELKRYNINEVLTGDKMKIDIHDLQYGVYLIHFEGIGVEQTIKFMKN